LHLELSLSNGRRIFVDARCRHFVFQKWGKTCYMRSSLLNYSAAAIVVLIWSAPALAVDDVSPRVQSGRLTTYGFDDNGAAGTQITANVLRVFPYFFGDVGTSSPYSTSNPGTNAAGTLSGYPPSNLPPPSAPPAGTPKYVAFDVLGDLQYWNGSEFGPVPAGESVTFSIVGTGKSLTVGTVGQASYPQFGFTIQNIAADGSMHKHMTTVLNPGSNSTPADGIYLVAMRDKVLLSDQQTLYPGIAPSLPFFVLFDANANNDITSATYTAAQNWVQTNLVPFGDFNRDHSTTIDDIPAMLSALTDLNAYKAANHLTDFDLTVFGDINGDGKVDNFDIQAMLDYIASASGGEAQAVPEPAALSLLLAAALSMFIGQTLQRSRRIAPGVITGG
jgi:hypothetical protein